jgi:hypothetical protein
MVAVVVLVLKASVQRVLSIMVKVVRVVAETAIRVSICRVKALLALLILVVAVAVRGTGPRRLYRVV